MLRWMLGTIYRTVVSVCCVRVLKALVTMIILLLTSVFGGDCYDFIIIVNHCFQNFLFKLDRTIMDYLLTERGCSMICISVYRDFRGTPKTWPRLLF
jgi:hypothetical protein